MALVHVDLVLANEKGVPTNGVFTKEMQDGVGAIFGLERLTTIIAIVFDPHKISTIVFDQESPFVMDGANVQKIL